MYEEVYTVKYNFGHCTMVLLQVSWNCMYVNTMVYKYNFSVPCYKVIPIQYYNFLYWSVM